MLRATAWLYRQSMVSDIDVTAITARLSQTLCFGVSCGEMTMYPDLDAEPESRGGKADSGSL
jgi:hypothetical protein